MHAVLGRSMNTPIVISDDEGEIMDIEEQSAAAIPDIRIVPHAPIPTPTMTAPAVSSDVYPKAIAVAPGAPATRLLRRLDTEPHQHVRIGIANGSTHKRKRTDSIGGSISAGQNETQEGGLVLPHPGTWSNLASVGQTSRLSKKQRKKLNKHLREQAEQRTIPPVEDILGWTAQFKHYNNFSGDSYVPSPHSVASTYRDVTPPPPPPSHAPPPIPMSSPPSFQAAHTSPQTRGRGYASATSSMQQIQGNAPRHTSSHYSPSSDLLYDEQQSGRSRSSLQTLQASATPWPPSSFVNNGKTIGSTAEEETKGSFNLEDFKDYPPPIVDRSLVVNPIPRRFRTREYFASWCKDIGLPPPKTVLVGPKVTKALLEFSLAEHAHKAFNSPRLKNIDGRASIRVYRYHVLPPRQKYASEARPVMQPFSLPARPQTIPIPPVALDDMEEGEICEDEGFYMPPTLDYVQPNIVQTPQQIKEEKLQQEDIEMDIAPSPIQSFNLTSEKLVAEVAPLPTRNSAQQRVENVVQDERKPSGSHDPSNGGDSVGTSSSSPSDMLASLRQRVLASKRKRTATVTPSRSDEKVETATGGSGHEHHSITPTSSVSLVNTSSSYMSLATTSSESSLAGSHSTAATSLNVQSTHLEDLATDFLNSILDPSKHLSDPYEARIDRKRILEEKQKRLERHIADSKQLMSNYTKAASKLEREQIMKSIRENNRVFDAENAESDADLQRIEKEIKFTFAWPETRRDDTILMISDSEDDCSSDYDSGDL